MSEVRVSSFAVSIDGFAAGPRQSLEHPLGVGGQALHQWAFATRTFRRHLGREGGSEDGSDEHFAAQGFANLGAWILGRNMFAPLRGPWPDETWRGWWGEEPPYHTPVFILTHHPRPSIEMKGGTTFHFVTGGIDEALAAARQAAGGKDVRVGGGVATLQQYLRARLIDHLHLAIAPVLLGAGENLFAGIDLAALDYQVEQVVAGAGATHVLIRRRERRPAP